MSLKTILIYNEQSSTSAPRVHKQLDALHKDYSIILASSELNVNDRNWQNLKFVRLSERKKPLDFHFNYPWILKKIISSIIRLKDITVEKLVWKNQSKYHWNSYYKSHYKKLLPESIDLIICHHVSSLPLCYRLKNKLNVPLIMNAHEYYPLQFEHKPEWVKNHKPIVDYLCEKYLPQIDDMFCVGERIGEAYKTNFKLKQFTLVKNDKPHSDCVPTSITEPIKIIHHGGCIRGRSLEKTVELAKHLDPEKYHIYLMLKKNDPIYYDELVKSSHNVSNITFLPVVPYKEIISFTNQFDIGLFLLPPTNFNYLNALPNKFFEFIQAKLCLCLSPNPEMKSLLDRYQLGVTANDYTVKSTAQAIQNLDAEKIMQFKINSSKHSANLSSETTEKIISERVSFLINLNN